MWFSSISMETLFGGNKMDKNTRNKIDVHSMWTYIYIYIYDNIMNYEYLYNEILYDNTSRN